MTLTHVEQYETVVAPGGIFKAVADFAHGFIDGVAKAFS